MPVHRLGDYFGGGIIFDVDTSRQHGLIAALGDQSAGVTWSNSNVNYRITGTSGDELGAGAMNTTLIIATQIGDNPTGKFAAKVAADFSVQENGKDACTGLASEICYGDWYLSSKFELNLLYQQRKDVVGFANYYYWSSTEYDASNAWLKYFSSGSQNYGIKFATSRVRAIRAF